MNASLHHEPLLAVEHLRVRLPQPVGAPATVVDDVGFALAHGESLGIVGESGSGKSQTALAILGLSAAGARIDGSIRFEGQEWLGMPEVQRNRLRGAAVAAVFQNPVQSLNPHLRIGAQMAEGLRVHRDLSRAAARSECLRWLDAVRVADPVNRLSQYPHELSGGMCQRICIAMALSCEPRLLIADEPTTALDVSTQAQLLDLLRALKSELRLALLLISHDLGVVAELCERTLVMRRGVGVELGATAQVLGQPQHPYTVTLVASRNALQAIETRAPV